MGKLPYEINNICQHFTVKGPAIKRERALKGAHLNILSFINYIRKGSLAIIRGRSEIKQSVSSKRSMSIMLGQLYGTFLDLLWAIDIFL